MKILVFISMTLFFTFTYSKEFIYDKRNIVAPIKDQVWIASKKLSEKELRKLVLFQYPFKIITYKKVYGLLVKIDENNKKQLEILEILKKTPNIDNVYNRVYEGSSGFKMINK